LSHGNIGPIGVLQERDSSMNGDCQVSFDILQRETSGQKEYLIEVYDSSTRQIYYQFLSEVATKTFALEVPRQLTLHLS